MQITEVKVFPIHEDKLKAFVSVVFDGCFMVNDIKVIRGRDGLFISMPSRKKKNGEFKDVAHPLNNETRRMIEAQILAEYERVLGERATAPPAVVAQAGAALPVAASPASVAMAAEPVSGDGTPTGARALDPVEPDAGQGGQSPEKTLAEVEEIHLRDSFWSVS
jgi:stage V sporulation protein G